MDNSFYKKKINKIEIIAPKNSHIKILEKSLGLIKKADANLYSKLPKRIEKIIVTRRAGYTNEFLMPEKIWFTNRDAINKRWLYDLASGIVHESVHATQFKSGKYIYPLRKLERQAIAEQKKLLNKLGQDSSYLDEALKNSYWRKMQKDELSFVHFRRLLEMLNEDKLNFKKV